MSTPGLVGASTGVRATPTDTRAAFMPPRTRRAPPISLFDELLLRAELAQHARPIPPQPYWSPRLQPIETLHRRRFERAIVAGDVDIAVHFKLPVHPAPRSRARPSPDTHAVRPGPSLQNRVSPSRPSPVSRPSPRHAVRAYVQREFPRATRKSARRSAKLPRARPVPYPKIVRLPEFKLQDDHNASEDVQVPAVKRPASVSPVAPRAKVAKISEAMLPRGLPDRTKDSSVRTSNQSNAADRNASGESHSAEAPTFHHLSCEDNNCRNSQITTRPFSKSTARPVVAKPITVSETSPRPERCPDYNHVHTQALTTSRRHDKRHARSQRKTVLCMETNPTPPLATFSSLSPPGTTSGCKPETPSSIIFLPPSGLSTPTRDRPSAFAASPQSSESFGANGKVLLAPGTVHRRSLSSSKQTASSQIPILTPGLLSSYCNLKSPAQASKPSPSGVWNVGHRSCSATIARSSSPCHSRERLVVVPTATPPHAPRLGNRPVDGLSVINSQSLLPPALGSTSRPSSSLVAPPTSAASDSSTDQFSVWSPRPPKQPGYPIARGEALSYGKPKSQYSRKRAVLPVGGSQPRKVPQTQSLPTTDSLAVRCAPAPSESFSRKKAIQSPLLSASTEASTIDARVSRKSSSRKTHVRQFPVIPPLGIAPPVLAPKFWHDPSRKNYPQPSDEAPQVLAPLLLDCPSRKRQGSFVRRRPSLPAPRGPGPQKCIPLPPPPNERATRMQRSGDIDTEKRTVGQSQSCKRASPLPPVSNSTTSGKRTPSDSITLRPGVSIRTVAYEGRKEGILSKRTVESSVPKNMQGEPPENGCETKGAIPSTGGPSVAGQNRDDVLRFSDGVEGGTWSDDG